MGIVNNVRVSNAFVTSCAQALKISECILIDLFTERFSKGCA